MARSARWLVATAGVRGCAPQAATLQPSDDPESNYFSAAHLSYCGQVSAARDRLMRAVEGNYCSYPAMTTNPLMANLRASADYARVEDAGRSCSGRIGDRLD